MITMIRADLNLYLLTESLTCFKIRVKYSPDYFNFEIIKKEGVDSETVWEKRWLFRWNLDEYLYHYYWVKAAWFDPMIKPPYDRNNYDHIPF